MESMRWRSLIIVDQLLTSLMTVDEVVQRNIILLEKYSIFVFGQHDDKSSVPFENDPFSGGSRISQGGRQPQRWGRQSTTGKDILPITSFCGYLPRMGSIVSHIIVVLVNRELSDEPVIWPTFSRRKYPQKIVTEEGAGVRGAPLETANTLVLTGIAQTTSNG